MTDRGTPAAIYRLRQDNRRVVVIDDDPTGTQTVSDVDIILRPTGTSLDGFFAGGDRCVYVLSNTRALGRNEAVRHLGDIFTLTRTAAERHGQRVAFVLRGDSTLRGHVFAEIDAIAARGAVILFVPAFPEGGRTTVDGVQWLDVDGRRQNVADTEFARDTTFGYRSRSLSEWVAEVGGGRRASIVALAAVRDSVGAAVRDALLAAPAGSVVIPEAETRQDVEAALVGLLDAEDAGRDVVVRSASTFASLRGGLTPRTVRRASVAEPRRVLAVCGSHTTASTAQLQDLVARTGVRAIEVDAGVALRTWQSGGRQAELVALLKASLDRHRLGIVSTSRDLPSTGDQVGLGSNVMRMLMDVVAAIVPEVQGVIGKGGITSAEIARVAMHAGVARVAGQVAPGVALWDVPQQDREAVPLAVIPGNVGGPSTLSEVARAFGVAA